MSDQALAVDRTVQTGRRPGGDIAALERKVTYCHVAPGLLPAGDIRTPLKYPRRRTALTRFRWTFGGFSK